MFDLELSDSEDPALTALASGMGRTHSMPIIEARNQRTEEWANTQFASAFHPFSDGDLTPLVRYWWYYVVLVSVTVSLWLPSDNLDWTFEQLLSDHGGEAPL